MRKYLKQMRLKKSLTQNEIADKLNITQQNYQQIESGRKKDLSTELICKFSSIFGISIDEIVKEESKLN